MNKWIYLAATLALSTSANATPLIINGGFEDLGNNVLSGKWSYFSSLPGWNGINNIEVHRDGLLADGFGNYYVELNAHPRQNVPFQIQSDLFTTVAGQQYELSFWAQKRRADDGMFSVSVDGFSRTINTHTTAGFTQFTFDFTGTGSLTSLTFISGQSGNDSLGHFLDDVSLNAVPEPWALALMGTGFLGLGIQRRVQSGRY